MPAVLASDDQGDPPIRERLDRGERRQHVGREAVVDERHPADRRRRPAAGSPGRRTPPRRARSAAASSAPGDTEAREDGAGDQRVAPVVDAAQASGTSQRASGSSVACTQRTRGPEQVAAFADQLAVAVGDREVRAGPRAQRELVAVVVLGIAAVPGEVVGVQRRHRDHRRRHRHVGGLIAGHLDDPVVDVLRDLRVERRRADVAADQACGGRGRAAGARRSPWWCSCPWCR